MDKLVLASPYCSISDKKIHGMEQIHLDNCNEILESIPRTFQKVSEPKPEMSMDEDYYVEQNRNSDMILQYAKTLLQKSLEDYEYFMNEKPTGDLEHNLEVRSRKRNYVNTLVPQQLDNIMFYIEALIHRSHWDSELFGQYKQIYDAGKKAFGEDKIQYLTQLRMCLMWAIPQDEFVKETQVIDPMFGSATRTIEA